MKRKYQVLLSLLVLVVMLLSMVSCRRSSCGGGSPNASGEKGFEGVTVEYASCFSEAEKQAVWMKEMADLWEKKTGGKINFNFAGRDVLTSVKSDILIGKAPDIIDNDASELTAALLSKDEVLLEPLNDVYTRHADGEDTPIKEKMNGAYTLYTEEGNDYIVPFIFITSGFFYDKTMFKDLGISAPAIWEDFIKVCDAIKKSGKPALAADGNISFYNCYYFQSLCQRIMGSGKFLEAALDPTGKAWDDPGFLEAAKKVSMLSEAGKKYFQEGYAGSAYPAAQSDWAMGESGMIYCGTWIPLETADLTGGDFKFGFFPFPTIDGGEGKVTDIEAQLMSFCVPKDASNKAAAKDFIAFCSSKKAADRLVELSDNMAARVDAVYPEALVDVKPTVDSATKYHKNYDGAMSVAPEWWANVFYPADDALFFGKISPEEFIKQMKDESMKFYSNK